jgi:cytochrome c5
VVVADAASGPHVDKSGEEVYQAVCLACHDAGALGSPKLGDKTAWSPRIAQGYETLIKHAIEGIRSMPARGGNPDLTDGEIANAVAFMANKAGANFTPPAAGAAPAAAEAAEPTATSTTPAVASPAPVAEMTAVAAVEAKPVAAAGKSGEEVFNGVCMACHSAGLMGAPKPGDNAAWAPRIAQGYDTLVQHAVKGIRMMPAKGGNAGLSDDEVAAAVKYMANKSGASF